MNKTLEKYELMKELKIRIPIKFIQAAKCWSIMRPPYQNISNSIAATILERYCREWLGEQGIFINCYGKNYYTSINSICSSFDDAQIEALKHCLKKRNI
jgi:hypothetical protein